MKAIDEIKKLRAKSVSELVKELATAKSKLADLKRNLILEKLKKTSDIKKIQKYIARIQTIMREKLEKELEKEQTKEKNAKRS